MSQPFLAEVKIISFNFPPKGWAFCNGQQLPINQNQALFSLLGTTYGGNGQTTFALPNLQSCTAIHVGSGYNLGQAAGESSHTLTVNEMPAHNHVPMGSATAAASAVPVTNVPAGAPVYSTAVQAVPMAMGSVTSQGGNQSHENMQPYLVLNFVIALSGIFPSRN